MTTITLPTDIEEHLAEEARRRGTTPEELAVAALRKQFVPQVPKTDGVGTLYDFLSGHIGTVSGTGEAWSEKSGERFAEGMLEKHKRG